MKGNSMKTRSVLFLSAAFTLLALALPVRGAGVDTPNPNLPPLYPPGYYTNGFANVVYNGGGFALSLTNIGHLALNIVNVNPVGADEIETFFSQLDAQGDISPGGPLAFTANGLVTTIVLGKVGNVTGTFNTEMLAMNISGGTLPPGVMIRESPTLPSLGQTTIAPIGGGLFHIDSFFDVFTELSIDGGQTWIPANGSERMTLVPEPSACALGGLAFGLLTLRGARRLRK
jgi:hypothetical protein